jgi:predicted transport protein
MGDIKLFRVEAAGVAELPGQSIAIEKTLQDLIERNLETFLGVRFLASEHSTGKTHGGRIDTLGLDENNCPVIIEYKRAINENVMNQGLFYLDWLLDHKAEFTLLAMKTLGQEVQTKIDWSSPRLLCIAGNYTKYDEHAVQQINRNIELFRYQQHPGFLVLELVNAATGSPDEDAPGVPPSPKASSYTYKTVTQQSEQAPAELRNLFGALEAYLLALGNDVSRRTLKYYLAFRRIKNFACVEFRPQVKHLLVFAKVDPKTITLEGGFTRDVSSIGHYGTGDLEITIASNADLEKAKPLILASYESA